MSTKEEYKHIGWRVFKTKNDKYTLTFDPNIISDYGALMYISEEVFNEAKKLNCSLEELFKKYDLENTEKLLKWRKPRNIAKTKIQKNTRNKFFGRGYFVEKTENGYIINYQLARHGGGMREFEISEQIYLYARNSSLTTNDIFKKFDLYKYDIPDNDVK